MLCAVLLAPVLLAAAPDPAPRLLVADPEMRGAQAGLRGPVTTLVSQAIADSGRFEVIAGDDVRRALTLAAEKQEAGCDISGCLEQVAGALGARFVVFGELAAVDDRTVLTLNLFDNDEMRSIARASADVTGGSGDAAVVNQMVRRLVRAYDGYRGAFPLVPVVGVGAGIATLASAAVVGAGVWQLLLLQSDRAEHGRLLDKYLETGDRALVGRAAEVQQSADAHVSTGTLLLVVGIPLTAASLAALGWAAWEAFE